MLNNLQQEYLKLIKKGIQKTIEATGDLIDNKIADRIMKTAKILQQKTWKKDNAQVSQQNGMLSIYCVTLGFTSLKLFKTIFFCFYILVEMN